MLWRLTKKIVVFVCLTYAAIVVITTLIDVADRDPKKMIDRLNNKIQAAILRKCLKIGAFIAKLKVRQVVNEFLQS